MENTAQTIQNKWFLSIKFGFNVFSFNVIFLKLQFGNGTWTGSCSILLLLSILHFFPPQLYLLNFHTDKRQQVACEALFWDLRLNRYKIEKVKEKFIERNKNNVYAQKTFCYLS